MYLRCHICGNLKPHSARFRRRHYTMESLHVCKLFFLISSWSQEAWSVCSWTVREQAANLFAASMCRCVLALTEEVCSSQSYLTSTKRGSTIWTPTAVKTWHFIILVRVSYLKDLDRLLKAKPSCSRQIKKVGCGHICFMEKKVLPAQKNQLLPAPGLYSEQRVVRYVTSSCRPWCFLLCACDSDIFVYHQV